MFANEIWKNVWENWKWRRFSDEFHKNNVLIVFSFVFFEVPIHNFLQNVLKSDSKREPKGTQKPPEWMTSDLSKHMVFTIWITHSAVSGELWEHIFSTHVSGHCFFVCLRLFIFVCQEGPPNRRVFWQGNVSKFDPVAKKLPRGPKGGPGAATWCQNAPRGCQNGAPQTSKLRIQQRNDRYWHLED